MKTVFLLVVALGLTAALYHDEEKKYEPNKEYWYDYKVQILSGLPETSKTTAGLLLKSKVKLILHQTKNDLIIKFEDIRLKQLMKELQVKPTTETSLREEDFVPVPAEHYREMEKELKKPCKARWEHGLITELKAAEDDPDWSVNMKKALLNALHLDLDQTTIRQNNDATYSTDPSQSWNDRQWMDVFDTRENTIYGECEPKYSIHHREEGRGPIMNVTKIVDPLKCKKRPVIQLSVSQPELCKDCEPDQKDLVKTNVEYSYGLLGNRQRFFIEKVEIKSIHSLKILRQEHGTVTHFIKAKLTYNRKTHVEPSSVSLPPMRSCPEVLKMKNPEEDEDKNIKMERRLKTSLLNEIERKIQNIAHLDTEEQPKAILDLIPWLKEASVEDLDWLVKSLLAPSVHTREINEQQKKIKKIFLVDIVPFIRTKESVFMVKILASKLGQRRCIVEPEDVKEMLNGLSMSAKPSKNTINDIEETCKLASVSTHKEMKKACWMAYANTMKRLLVNEKQDTTSSPVMNDVAFINKQKDTISELLRLARTENEQLLAVKVMANVPLMEFVQKCVSIASEKTKPMIVRVEAAKALKLYAKINPEKVVSNFLPFVMDKRNPTEVRAMAFKALLECKPKTTTLHMITRWLNDEDDAHLVSYCKSHLIAVSKSELPCQKQWARTVHHCIKMIHPKNPGITFSWDSVKSFYSDKIRQGIRLETSALTTSKSFVPKMMHAKAEAYLMGRNVNLLEISTYTNGLQKLIEKLLGPNGSWKNSDSVFDLVRRKRDINVRDEPVYRNIESHHQEINDRLRSLWIAREDPKIAINMKLLGVEMPFIDIDSDFLKNTMSDGRFHIDDNNDWLRDGFPLKFKKNLIVERLERIMPCPVGFAMKVKFDTAVSVKMDGRAKLAVEPNIFRRVRNGQIPDEVKIELKSEPKVATYMKVDLALEVPTLKIASKIKAKMMHKVPIDLKIKATPQEDKVEVEYKPIPQDFEAHTIEIKPENEIKMKPKPVKELTSLHPQEALVEKREIKPAPEKFTYKEEDLLETTNYQGYERTDLCDVLGMKLEAKMKHYKPTSRAQSNMLTPKILSVKVKPCRNCPEKFIFRTKLVKVTRHSSEDDWDLIRTNPESNGNYNKVKLEVIALSMNQEKPLLRTKIYMHHDDETKKTKADCHMQFKPLNGDDLEVCIAGKSTLPSLPEVFTRPLPEHQFKWPLIVDFNFGKCHQGTPAIRAQINVVKSEQQVQIESVHYSTWPEYQTCVNEPEYRRKHVPECKSLMLALASARKYHIVVDSDTNQIPSDILSSMRKCPYLLKCPLLAKVFSPSAPARQHIVIDLSMPMIDTNPEELPKDSASLIHAKVQQAEEEPYTVNYNLPVSIPVLSLYDGPRSSRPDHKGKWEGTFYLRGQELITFDGRRIPVEWRRNCETILTKDCSDDRGFAITAKRNPITNKKELKITIDGYVCKIEAAAYSSGSPIVTVDNVRYTLSEDRELRFPRSESSSESLKLKVKKLDNDLVLVESPEYGIKVKTNGIFAEAKVPKFKFGSLCGLAGNFDDQPENDNIGSTYIAYQNWDDLFKTYNLPSDQCPREFREPEFRDTGFRSEEREQNQEQREERRSSSSIFDW